MVITVVAAGVYRLWFHQRHYDATDDTIAQFCGRKDEMVFEDAPSYQGSGQHPVVIANAYRRYYVGDGKHVSQIPSYRGTEIVNLPWNAAAKDAQLVGCIEKEVPKAEERLCDLAPVYKGVDVDRFTSVGYEITLYELRTGRRVASATVAAAPRAECPKPESWVYLQQPDEYLFPGEQQYRQALGQYVEN